MKNLKPMKGLAWTCKMKKQAGKYKSREGYGLSGFYIEDLGKDLDILVLSNGHFCTHYKYPKVKIPFTSPMHRWDNLLFNKSYTAKLPNGASFDSPDRMLTYVANRRKPLGFVYLSNSKTARHYIYEASKENIVHKKLNEYHGFGLANKGQIEDLFDIDAVIKSYELLSEAAGYSCSIINPVRLKRLAHGSLEDFLNYNHLKDKKTKEEIVLNGLILGYPIESTFYFVTQNE